MPQAYLIQCFNCLSDFDATEAIWCSCNPQRPSKVCPFCMGCFCAAGPEFKEAFWKHAPDTLLDELNTLSQSRMLIGKMLVRSGLISTDQLLEALKRQKTDPRKLGEILVDSGALAPDRLETFLKTQHTAIAVDLSRARVDAPMLRRLGVDQCLRDRILPLEPEALRDKQIMTLAMADPSNAEAIERVRKATGFQVIPGVVPAESIVTVIRSIFPQGSATSDESPAAEAAAASSPAIDLLRRAARRRASHIQIQAAEGALKLYLRVDGTLYLDKARSPRDVAVAIEAFKELAGLQGDTRTVPRVGRAQISLDGVDTVVVVRTRPGREGEEMSVKKIDPFTFPPRLPDLGYPEELRGRLERALERPNGLILISSPPFSGATSTLHALGLEAADQGRRLALVESPRTIALSGQAQEEFFPEIRNSLVEALGRAASSGADAIAVTSADWESWPQPVHDLPGRVLLMTRIDAMSLPQALVRLVQAGYPAAALAGRPTLVVHQRLVRRICPSCRTAASTADEHASALGLTSQEASRFKLWKGAGCDDCAATPGFRGRAVIAHALSPDAGVARALERGVIGDVAAACRNAGMTPLRREALSRLAAGVTSVEEIARRKIV